MSRFHRRAIHFLILAATLSSGRSADNTVAKDEEQQCGLYLALSSTSTGDRSQWGVYAGKTIEKNQIIGSAELAVNAIHLRANNIMGPDTPDEVQAPLLRSLEFLEESFWVPDAAGARFELDRGRIISAISGNGFLGSSNVKLTNADWNHRASYQRRQLGEETGVPHPGRGAISPFYNVELRATDDLKAGSEVFVNYGTTWEDNELNDELLKPDYAKIDETVDQLIEFFKKHSDELDTDSKQEIYQFITKDVMTAAVGPNKARKVAAILPPGPDDLESVRTTGGTLKYSQPTVFRNIDWLKEHGRCMDNLQPGPSTIKNAGRGAFARRSIKKGDMVAPTPLLHIPNWAVLDMHQLNINEDGDFARESNEVIGQQLLYNYCLGHQESKMLFYPVGSSVGLINHADEPNARLTWSTHPSHQKFWLSLEPDELLSSDFTYMGLLMEVVALRDIEEGEEVFIDYGASWKAAWEEHVRNWEERINSGEISKDWPVHAVDLNEEYRSKVYKTEKELEEDPYPENVSLGAFLMLEDSPSAGGRDNPAVWTVPANGTFFLAESLFEPVVIGRIKVDDPTEDSTMPFNYTVRWSNNKGEETYVKNVPHSAFVFVDEPETSDQFTDHPFRHYIAIPDDIFPKGPWRNAEE